MLSLRCDWLIVVEPREEQQKVVEKAVNRRVGYGMEVLWFTDLRDKRNL